MEVSCVNSESKSGRREGSEKQVSSNKEGKAHGSCMGKGGRQQRYQAIGSSRERTSLRARVQ